LSVIPEKREDLVAMGYVYTGDGKCRDCHVRVEWWIKPNGKRVPLTVHEEGSGLMQEHTGRVGFFRKLHFLHCPERKER
jgi:hypothetical protein